MGKAPVAAEQKEKAQAHPAIVQVLSQSAASLGSRLADPIVLSLMSACVIATLAIRRPPPPSVCLREFRQAPLSADPFSPPSASAASAAAAASRFHIEAYAMPGPIKWKHLSEQAKGDFTLEGKIPVASYPRADKGSSQPVWAEDAISRMQQAADKREPSEKVCPYGESCNDAFFKALSAHAVAGQDVLVVGSITPWLEATCLSFGANSTTTVDFTQPLTAHPRVRSQSIAELDASGAVYDAVFSYSSLEHDGLGRYGDPLNPAGDLLRMRKLRGLLRPGGKLYLGVPNGPDFLVFNAHRIYGRERFPLLIHGWKLLGTYGDDLEAAYGGNFTIKAECFPKEHEGRKGCYTQPVHVLQVEDQ